MRREFLIKFCEIRESSILISSHAGIAITSTGHEIDDKHTRSPAPPSWGDATLPLHVNHAGPGCELITCS